MPQAAVFERPHHQRIAQVLRCLDAQVLRANSCLFGGGTVIALRYGEYRESVDIDFLVSDADSYRRMRQLLTGAEGIAAIVRQGAPALTQDAEMRADQYGVRTMLAVDGQRIKFEMILEGRIALDTPGARDEIWGVPTLTPIDMATSKLLANSDRWRDDGVFSRDLIDLAMIGLELPLLRRAVAKAERAYGASVLADLGKAIDAVRTRRDWLDRCMRAMAMTLPKAVLWQRIRAVARVLPKTA